jgi:hypothetical protein
MHNIIRHDAITLLRGVREEDFERFMQEELLPYFSKRYQGPTRTSRADLQSQSLLKDTKGRRRYLWVTVWDGSSESVRGSSFENTRMIKVEATEAKLKKLDSFGKRSSEKVMSELISTKVPRNT